jgi:hypothetical protein
MGVLIKLLLLLTASGLIVQEATRPVFIVSGVVQYPDGKPSAGATVTGVTACQREPYHRSQEAKTAADGSFNLQFVESECGRIRLSAIKADELWLKTGKDIFYAKENGTAPIVEATTSGRPTETLIKLGERGGLVEFRVWDTATERFIFAEVYLERISVPGSNFGSKLFATGRDGSADTLFLPAGEYRFSIQQYACNGANYSTVSNSSHGSFTVSAGQRVSEDFSVDIRQIKPLKSNSNPHGKPCLPALH